VILSIVNKAVSNFFHFSAENNYLFGIHKIIALAELMGAVLLKGVTKSDLDNGLTSPSRMIVMFVSGYINQITPTANYISGYAVRYTSLNTEMQVVVDYAGKLYSRTKNLSDGSWTGWL
jgi:hypothetical protein